MTDPAASPLAEVGSAVGGSQEPRAVQAAMAALRANVAPIEILRAAARGAAAHYDASANAAPRGLVVLAAAANLFSVIQPRFRALPTLQAVAFVASEKKSSTPAKPPLVVAGEVTHLVRSFLFGVRSGDLPEAESIFLGMVEEGWERKMAGDILFRAAMEDMGEGGRKLFIAVKAWQLGGSLGFKDARTILRPAIRYLVGGPRDRTAFETILNVLGKEWVDLEALASGGHLLDDEGRAKLSALLAARDPASCIGATLALLRDGYAAVSISDGLVAEAAKRTVGANGYDVDTARGLMFAHATRFVLTFSRTSERLYALFQAALRVRSPEPAAVLPATSDAPGEAEELRHLAGAFEARKPMDAAARTRDYVQRRYSTSTLLDLLANYASRDSASANGGINLILADVCATEFLATRTPEVPMALAKMIAASPKDQAAYESWTPLLTP